MGETGKGVRITMNENKICPLMQRADPTFLNKKCSKECGWYDIDNNCCSMISLARFASIYSNTVDGRGNITIGINYK